MTWFYYGTSSQMISKEGTSQTLDTFLLIPLFQISSLLGSSSVTLPPTAPLHTGKAMRASS